LDFGLIIYHYDRTTNADAGQKGMQKVGDIFFKIKKNIILVPLENVADVKKQISVVCLLLVFVFFRVFALLQEVQHGSFIDKI
jgi:hypothetical protein